MRVHQQEAFVLLNRPYSESSWIVEAFSRNHGRIALMAKGARRFKSRLRGVLLPFQPLLISWSGKGEVPTLTAAEIQHTNLNMIEHELAGDGLACGFYCNELIAYLLHRHDPHPKLFDLYQRTVLELHLEAGDQQVAQILREFEQNIIKETGYEVDFAFEEDGKTPLNENTMYDYLPGRGFAKRATNSSAANNTGGISGRVILALSAPRSGEDNAIEIASGKQLMRDILRHSLGDKTIHSRALFFPKSR